MVPTLRHFLDRRRLGPWNRLRFLALGLLINKTRIVTIKAGTCGSLLPNGYGGQGNYKIPRELFAYCAV
jgi:hypothetical protein